MNKVSWEQLWPALRSLFQIAMGYAIGRGLITAEQAQTLTADLQVIVPALASLAVVLYGMWKRSPTNLVKSAATVDGVTVSVDPVTAAASVVTVAADPTQPNVKIETK